tara:strand:+ start:155 stop:376 length:222 start_codon:yes stop_codon:yes gene_type:complete
MARGGRKEEEKAEKVATFASVTGTEDASVSRRILKVLSTSLFRRQNLSRVHHHHRIVSRSFETTPTTTTTPLC